MLAADDDTYLQCAKQDDAPSEYTLEFQEGGLGNHYRAADFTWQRIELWVR